ncbi:MAG: LysR substrate-binding domain-containing protein [Pseudomonadota bacterium]
MSRSALPPLAAIRVFEAAARHGTFTRAAEELGMTQAAVSYQVKVLEERVGAPLFQRQARGVVPTHEGAAFAARLGGAFDTIAEAYAAVRGAAEEMLAISVIPTFATTFLGRRLGGFQIANPDLAVRVEMSEGVVDLPRSDFDLAIRGGRGDWPGVTSRKLLDMAFTPMLSPGLARSVGRLTQPEDLLDLPILSPGDPWWRRWCSAVGLKIADMAGHQGAPVGAQVMEAQAAMAGQGVAILAPALFRAEIEMGLLVQPFDLICRDGSAYWLCAPEGRRPPAKVRRFETWLMGEVAAAG